MSDPRDLDPLTGMNTSAERFYYAYDKDGGTIGSFGTQWEATAAENAYAQEKLRGLSNADLPSGLRSNFPSGSGSESGRASGCLKAAIITIVVIVVIVIVLIVLLSLLGDYAASHINQHA
jgi:hypothetical protein